MNTNHGDAARYPKESEISRAKWHTLCSRMSVTSVTSPHTILPKLLIFAQMFGQYLASSPTSSERCHNEGFLHRTGSVTDSHFRQSHSWGATLLEIMQIFPLREWVRQQWLRSKVDLKWAVPVLEIRMRWLVLTVTCSSHIQTTSGSIILIFAGKERRAVNTWIHKRASVVNWRNEFRKELCKRFKKQQAQCHLVRCQFTRGLFIERDRRARDDSREGSSRAKIISWTDDAKFILRINFLLARAWENGRRPWLAKRTSDSPNPKLFVLGRFREKDNPCSKANKNCFQSL